MLCTEIKTHNWYGRNSENVKVSNDQHHDLNVKEMIEGYLFIC